MVVKYTAKNGLQWVEPPYTASELADFRKSELEGGIPLSMAVKSHRPAAPAKPRKERQPPE